MSTDDLNESAPPENPSHRKNVAARLLEKRLHMNLSRQDLAKRTGWSESTVEKIECGELAPLSERNVEKLSASLGVSVDWILTGKDSATPTQQ
jgi:transcriptional regulator with XRE-family HTH domain